MVETGNLRLPRARSAPTGSPNCPTADSHQPVEVVLNRAVVDHDVSLVVGPVFPHEVVGFSGGNKYFFPGVAGQEVIDFSHWLGALITSADIIGTRGITPVRALINEAAALIPSRRLALCLVAQSGTSALHAASFGAPEDAWAACAEVSAQTHVRYLDAPVRRVLSIIPTKYEDMWTGAKGFYKVEPVVADGGQVIIYAPHITEISVMHPAIAADRLPLPRLLPRPVGHLLRLPLGRPRPLHPPARGRHLGPGQRRAGPGHRHPGHRHTRRTSSARPTWTTWTRPLVDIAAMEADPDTLVAPASR